MSLGQTTFCVQLANEIGDVRAELVCLGWIGSVVLRSTSCGFWPTTWQGLWFAVLSFGKKSFEIGEKAKSGQSTHRIYRSTSLWCRSFRCRRRVAFRTGSRSRVRWSRRRACCRRCHRSGCTSAGTGSAPSARRGKARTGRRTSSPSPCTGPSHLEGIHNKPTLRRAGNSSIAVRTAG